MPDIMSLIGNAPRSVLERILATLGRLNEAQYEHETPVERNSDVELQLGDQTISAPPPEAPPPEATRPGPERRTGKLSGFGKFTKGVLPEMLRGAMVGASNPVKGGTAEQIFGTMRNVMGDRQDREDRAMQQEDRQFQWHRANRQDADRSELHQAQMENQRAQAEQRMAQARKAGAGFKEAFDPAYQAAIEAGKTPQEAWAAGMGYATKNPFAYAKPRDPKSAQETRARLQAMLARGEITQEFYNEYEENEKIFAREMESAKAFGSGQGKAAWVNPRYRQTPVEGGFVQRADPRMLPDKMGNPTLEASPPSTMLTMPGGEIAKPPPRATSAKPPSVSEQRYQSQSKVTQLVNRLLAEDTGRSPETTLRNVQQFYKDDPEVQEYRAQIIEALQKLIKGAPKPAKKDGTLQRPSGGSSAPQQKDSLGIR